jgi:hypothetical protein
MIRTHGKAPFVWSALAFIFLYAILLLPDSNPVPPIPASGKPFVWNLDQRWDSLEARFSAARKEGCASLLRPIEASLAQELRLLAELQKGRLQENDTLFDKIEQNVYSLGPMVGVCPEQIPAYTELVTSLRSAVKDQSAGWDMNSRAVRDKMYRLLYGSRAALEEVLLQAPPGIIPSSLSCYEEPSLTPAATILGVQVHSGDILVSRGGAPTSALIARGNDYPGNFSHVALLYVDSLSGKVSIIESHIERGVAIASLDEYLRDTKLRVMVLRLRSDLPVLKGDPMLPDRAARFALQNARSHHIPYDFAMDFDDSSKLFCSEVVSSAYRQVGIRLWMGLSHISSAGVASWLSDFGVKHFETQEPSDLEYDPQLRVVAEWRDRDALFKDHVDNALVDVMLEGAEMGEKLHCAWYMLPVARVIKGYSLLLNEFGGIGPVPEGMSATSALKHKYFSNRHTAIKARVLEMAKEFTAEKGYVPPYWELVKLAREAGVKRE